TLQKDDPEAALEHFRNAQKYRSQAPEIFYQMGLAYLKLEKLDQAKTAFEAVIRLQSRHSQAHYGLGQVWFQQNKLEA
ncbi:tetratricopeptide repeat protein, partial [Planococcus sp. SIMBA_160]